MSPQKSPDFQGRFQEIDKKAEDILIGMQLPFTAASGKYPTPIKPAGSPPSSEQSSSSSKPKRAAYTEEEKDFLFASYRENPYPSVSRRTEIADFLQKPFSQISCWFKNQRARSGDFKKGTPGKKLPKVDKTPITAIKMDLADGQDISPPCLPATLESAQTSTTATVTAPITTEKVLPPATNLSTSIHSSNQVLMPPRVNHQKMEPTKEDATITENTHHLGKQSPSPEIFNTYPHLGFQQPMFNTDQQQLHHHLSNAGFRSDHFGEDPQKLLRLAIYNARCASALATEATTKALTANIILNALMKQMQSPFSTMRSDQTSDGASGSSGSSSSGSAADGPTDDGFEINVDRISDSDSIVNIRTH